MQSLNQGIQLTKSSRRDLNGLTHRHTAMPLVAILLLLRLNKNLRPSQLTFQLENITLVLMI